MTGTGAWRRIFEAAVPRNSPPQIVASCIVRWQIPPTHQSPQHVISRSPATSPLSLPRGDEATSRFRTAHQLRMRERFDCHDLWASWRWYRTTRSAAARRKRMMVPAAMSPGSSKVSCRAPPPEDRVARVPRVVQDRPNGTALPAVREPVWALVRAFRGRARDTPSVQHARD